MICEDSPIESPKFDDRRADPDWENEPLRIKNNKPFKKVIFFIILNNILKFIFIKIGKPSVITIIIEER
jgi:hypothetical protein